LTTESARVRSSPSRPPDWFTGSSVLTADAPGRVNLIGEHTDYNGGFVLPLTIPQRTYVQLSARRDRRVRVWSDNLGGAAEYGLGEERRTGGWVDYIQGVTWALAAAGHTHDGVDLAIRSDVPVGSGLSSSAALMVAALRGLRAVFTLPIDDLAIARLAHEAETGLVGAPVGVMDQMVCSLGDASSALFLDTRTMDVERVSLPSEVELAVIDSGLRHSNASGEYRVRRAECQRACEVLGIRELRDLPPKNLELAARLPEPLARRVRHVVTENARVLESVEAMRRGEVNRLGHLLDQSHVSMRDDYEISVPAVNLLVELARAQPGTLGARLTGGGFGGAIIMLVSRGLARAAATHTVDQYRSRTGHAGRVLVPPDDTQGVAS
jgi:galactokinase